MCIHNGCASMYMWSVHYYVVRDLIKYQFAESMHEYCSDIIFIGDTPTLV